MDYSRLEHLVEFVTVKEFEKIMDTPIAKLEKDIRVLLKIAYAVDELPFGEIPALPWCRSSFPKLDDAMKEWEVYKESSLDNLSFLTKE